MPKILLKDVWVEIRHSLGRFLSITAIVALGVAFFAGIKGSAPDMKYTADQYFDKYNLQDIQVYSTVGLDDADLKAISKIKGVKNVQPVYSMDVLSKQDNHEEVIKLFGLYDNTKINNLRLTEGRMPTKENECLIEAGSVYTELYGNFSLGDKLKLESGTDTPLSDDLKNTEYTIVGKCFTPYYLSYEKGTSAIGSGKVDSFIYVPSANIKADYYTEIDVTVDGAKSINAYDDSYFDVVDPILKKIEKISDGQVEARIAKSKDEVFEAQNTLNEEIEKGQKKIDDAKKQIEESKKQLEDGKMQLANGEKQIADNEAVLASGEKQLNDGWNQYYTGKKELEANEAKLNSGIAQIEAGLKGQPSKAQLQSSLNQINDGIAQIEEGIKKLQEAQTKLPSLESSKTQLEEGIAKLDQAITAFDGTNATYNQLLIQKESLQASIASIEMALKQDLPEDQKAKLESQLVEAKAGIEQVNTGIAEIESAFNGKPDLSVLQAQKAQLENQLAQVNAGIEQIKAALAAASIDELNAQKADLESKKSQVEKGLQAYSMLEQLHENQKQLAAGKAQLSSSLATLNEKQKELESGKAQLAKAKAQLADSKAEIEKGKKELTDGENELISSQQKLEDERKKGQEKIDDAKKQIEDLDGKWIVLDRDSHYSYRDYEACADRMDGIASVFPVFFFLVAALVCMTTMSRMVDEERTEIGTFKALGYSKAQIAFKYIAYACLASVLGSIIGCSFGMFVFPYIIFNSWNMMYNLDHIRFLFQPGLMFMAGLAATAVILLATLFSIYRELMDVPSQLMRPKASKAGKKILLEKVPWIWNRISFLKKVTIRNIFRYKKRFFMTVIGISGCTALLVAGFGINDSISDIVNLQYNQIYKFNATLTSEEGDAASLIKEVSKVSGVTGIYEEKTVNATAIIDNKEQQMTVRIVNNPKEFENYVDLHSRIDKAKFEVPEEGALVSERMAKKMDVKEGDTFTFKDLDDKEYQLKVAGVYENYVGHVIYISQEQANVLKIPEDEISPVLLLKTKEQNSEYEANLGNKLMKLDGAKSVVFYSTLQSSFLDIIDSIKMVVYVLVFCAAALAFVVLYNLSNVNISERMREIATIKVLGFTEKEVNKYINRESVVLSAIGSIVGLFVGIYLHDMIMSLAEMDDIMFGRTINFQSFILSIVLTMVFTFFVNWVMKFKLRKIEMVESLKAVE